MTPQFFLCDRCNNKTHCRFFIETGTQMDGAGSRESVGETVDLCGDCMQAAIQHWLLKQLDDAKRKAFCEWLKKTSKAK